MENVLIKKEDFDQLVESLSVEAKSSIETLVKKANKGNEDALTELKGQVADIAKSLEVEGKRMPDYMKAIQEQINKVEEKIATEVNKPRSYKTIRQVIHEEAVKRAEELKKLWATKDKFEFKTVGDMSLASNVGTGVVLEGREAGVTVDAKRSPWLLDILPIRSTTSNLITWVENQSTEGAPTSVSESGVFPQTDYDFIRRTLTIEKVATYGKVTREMVEDADQLVSYIEGELLYDLKLVVDGLLLTGDGSTPNISGLTTLATAFAVPGSYAFESGVSATEIDVLRAAIAQIDIAHYSANAILMNPTDIMKMDLAKDKNYNYVTAPFATNGNRVVSGIPVYSNTGITAGYFLVLDTNKTPVYFKRGFELKLWEQNSTDPQYDLMTITASCRMALRFKNAERKAAVYGNFATGIAALETT